MPTYTDQSSGKRIRSDQPLTDTELEEAFGGGGDQSTAGERAGSYVEHKANEFVSSGQNLLADIMGQGQPAGRTNWQRAQDVGTVAAPFVAPEMTAAGLGVGTGARALGADEPTADVANTVAQLGTGGVQAARGVAGVGRNVAAKFGRVAESMGQRGTLLAGHSPEGYNLFWDLARATQRFAPNTAERSAAEGVMHTLAQGGGLTYGDLDTALTQVQGISRDSNVAGILRAARDGLTRGPAALGGSEGSDLASAYRASRRANMAIPGRRVMQSIAGGAGGVGALYEARKGNYTGAAKALALGGLAATGAGTSVGHLLAAAGPAARTAASLSGPAMRSLEQPETGVESGPEIAPGTPAEQGPTPDVAARKPNADVAVRGPFGREIAAVASVVKIPPQLLHAVVRQESSGNPNALSHPTSDQVPTPAHGLMQITEGTFNSVKREASALLGREAQLSNPLDNLVAGGLLWRNYLDKSGGDLRTAAHLYHGGENPAYWGPHTQKYGEDILQKFAEETQ